MDIPLTGHSFDSISIIHFLTMALAFLICYPYSITQQSHSSSQKRYLISLFLTVLLTFVGLVTGWFIQYSTTTSSDAILPHTALKLSLFLLTSLDLALEYISSGFSILYQHRNTFHSGHQQQQGATTSSLFYWIYHVPEIAKVSIKWITLCLGYFYLVFVLTSTDGSIGQCWLPLAMGTGFVFYGSLALMHLVNIIPLRPHSNVEYYEALMMISWGFLSFMWWDTPILGSSWKAINVGLLWTTGGILSLAVAFQSWVPMLQKRNVINSIIICLTGKGILTGYTNDDDYTDELQTTLGYILIIGSVARFTQIMFRKSATDTLPRLYARTSGGSCDDVGGDDDETCVDDLDIGKRRENDYELAYRQLTGMGAATTAASAITCKHQSVYASITMVSGVLSCFMAVSGGFVFIGAIPGWVETMRYYVSDPSTYVNVLLATSFLWTAYLLGLCSLYKTSTNSAGLDYLDIATTDYSELPLSSKSPPSPPGSYYDTTYNNMSSMMTTSTSSASSTSHIVQQQPGFSTIPLTSCSKSAPPLSKTNSNGSSTSASSPPMRPSQYRAKRRSLLISTSMQNNNQDNNNIRAVRTSSTSGPISVGGILPDEVSIYGDFYCASSPVNTVSSEHPPAATKDNNVNGHQHSQHGPSSSSSSPTIQRRSWRSSTSSSLLSSSPPRMTASNSNALIGPSYSSRDVSWHQQQQQPGHGEDGNHVWAVYKTESGKRKERQWKNATKRPQAAPTMTTSTSSGYILHGDEQQQQQDNGYSTLDGRGRPQDDSGEYIGSDSRVF